MSECFWQIHTFLNILNTRSCLKSLKYLLRENFIILTRQEYPLSNYKLKSHPRVIPTSFSLAILKS